MKPDQNGPKPSGASAVSGGSAVPGGSGAFAARLSVEQVEEGFALAPKFDAEGLIPCITTDAATGEVLMLGYMNGAALEKTIATGEAHYWSRSRQCLWRKGATSGLAQKVEEMRVDDDQDAIWLRVRVAGSGASCHVGYRSCFYRSVELGGQSGSLAGDSPGISSGISPGGPARLRLEESRKTFDPKAVYGDAPNPTQL
ncbi:phosphoribosyl-AMP cyclohydrolase [Denitrobaculum tricleocarpae]|uniref:Phosphoribosyl-AMP cyclohydrolase n=1 Tax=Denitrobaculum tricleocarpae TaxID=2591009 RepID=A0A545SXN7_9PROT|nr:phosphoribosyl-AMP cyclohydrolase [Denitrobaculum tricleocarpae]TQV69726.1 phosphoribosyl-AMP cyclohydrolase [Denitrobaculum tricleocarpae]